MRITMNGPDDLEKFPAEKLAKSWGGMQTGNPIDGGGGYQSSHPKRKNPEPAESASSIPPKMIALGLDSPQIDAEAARDLEQDSRVEYELGLLAADDQSARVYVDAEFAEEIDDAEEMEEQRPNLYQFIE